MGNKPRAGTKAAFNEVLEAIRTLKSIEKSGRAPGPADKAMMAKFSGFGAFATKAFPDPVTDEYADGWEYLGVALRELLTDEEYESAKRTTFSAFYTSELVMAEMYRALERMGIGMGARGLEPGCGVGNFIGASPIIGLDFIGVEQDSLSGRMAQIIHPEHDIRIEGFQHTELPDGSVDFAIGNVPFAEIKLRHRGQRHSLHDFFFLKSLDAVRPGGVMALVTSRYTMDKVNSKVRQLLAEQADFVGAVRLPGEAFQEQGTKVVTDIIFLRKKPHQVEKDAPEWADHTWLTASKTELDGGEVALNNYFQANPHMVIGEMSVGQGMYNNQDLRVRSDGEIAAALHAAIDGLPGDVVTARTEPLASASVPKVDASLPDHVQEGSFYVTADQTIMQVVGGRGEPVMQRDKPLMANGTMGGKRLGALITLRDRARAVLKAQQDGRSDSERDTARQRLRTAYASFRAQYGAINKTTLSTRKDGGVTRRMPNVVRFKSDPDVYLVMALEKYDERTDTATPAAIMERDVVTQTEEIGAVENAKDGLLASLNFHGSVDVAYIASLYGRSEAEVIEELGKLIFFDPEEDMYVPADQYLSGNVRQKLLIAEASTDPRTAGNAEALKLAQPKDLEPEEIDVSLGTPWIPPEDVERFISETLGIAPSNITVEYVSKEALWSVKPSKHVDRRSAVAISEYGTEDIDAYSLIAKALNMRTPTIRRLVIQDGNEKYVVDQEATLAAQQKQAELKQAFSGWAFDDPARSERYTKFYNANFNNIRLRQFDGDHLTFPRMSAEFQGRLYKHQKAAIWRNMSAGNTLLAHTVGAGKTFEMIATGMEMKRTGLANKPMYVVPNHMLEQFAREHLILYPDANLLVATKQDLSHDRRQLLKARMATGQWDGIIMTHSSFEKIAMSPGYQERFLAEQIAEYEDLLVDVDDRSLKGNITKKIEKLKAQREAKLEEMANSDSKDGGLYFDELGVDHLFVDEAHLFKNLETPTKMDRVAGVQTGGSKRAFDLLMKSRYLQSRTPGRGLTFATGTPVSNSLGELYTMMRYLMPDLLEERGIAHFDAWAAAFGEVINALEISPDGKSLRVKMRFAQFTNLPELLSLFRLCADVQTAAMLDLPVPELKGGKAEVVVAPMSESAKAYQQYLVERYEKVRAGGVHPSADNALNIITDGRKLALDERMVNPGAADDPNSKINQLVDRVYEIWQRTAEDRSTQMIFSDLGVKETEAGFSFYNEIIEKLEARGIPREEIANIGDANTDVKKESLFSSVRAGQVRVLLGSTAKMGTGVNAQERLFALHHVDPPWRPADIEQREGRILRQGNKHKELGIPVEIYRYVTEGSFDAFMWQTLETKARFISAAMAGDAGCRRANDIGGAELTFAEVKAIASGNPAMLVLAEMELDLRQVTLLRNAHSRDQRKISRELDSLPDRIVWRESRIDSLQEDIENRLSTKGEAFVMKVGDHVFAPEKGEKKTARQRAQDALAQAIVTADLQMPGAKSWEHKLGEIGGMDIVLKSGKFSSGGRLSVTLEGAGSYLIAYNVEPMMCPNLVQGMEQMLKSFEGRLATHEGARENLLTEQARYEQRAGIPFASEEAFQKLRPLRDQLQVLLSKQESEEARDGTEEGPSVEDQIEGVIDAYRNLTVHAAEPPTVVEAEEPAPIEAPEAVEAVAVEVDAQSTPSPVVDSVEAVASHSELEPEQVAADTANAETVDGVIEGSELVEVKQPVPPAAVAMAPDSQTHDLSMSGPAWVLGIARYIADAPFDRDALLGPALAVAEELCARQEGAVLTRLSAFTAVQRKIEHGTLSVTDRDWRGEITDALEISHRLLRVVRDQERTPPASEIDGWLQEELEEYGGSAEWISKAMVAVHHNAAIPEASHDGAAEWAGLVRVWSKAVKEELAPDGDAAERESEPDEVKSVVDTNPVIAADNGQGDDKPAPEPVIPPAAAVEPSATVEPSVEEPVRPTKSAARPTKPVATDADQPTDTPLDILTFGKLASRVDSNSELAIVRVDGGCSLAAKQGEVWNIRNLYPLYPSNPARYHERHGYGWRDDAWVAENLASAEWLDVITDLAKYLTAAERDQLVVPEQRDYLARRHAEVTAESSEVVITPDSVDQGDDKPAPLPVVESVAEPVTTPVEVAAKPIAAREPEAPTGEDKAIAIVGEVEDDGVTYFQLAEKMQGSDAWSILSLYPEHPHRDRYAFEPLRKGHGTRDDAWVREHIASADMLDDLGQYLTADELSRVIPEIRDHLAQQVEEVGDADQLASVDAPMNETPTPKAPAIEQSAPTVAPPRRNGHGRGQIGLLLDTETAVASPPPPERSQPVSQPISRHPVQMGLFDDAPAEKPTASARRSIIAESYRPAAKDVRVSSQEPSSSDWTTEDDELFNLEMQARGKLSKDDPLYVAPPEITFDDLDEHEQRQAKEIVVEFDFLWEGATWAQAIGSYESKFFCTISDRLFDHLTAEDRKEEAEQWKESLSAGEERDMIDRLDNGGYAGEPVPTEDAVVGRFTRLVEDRTTVADIVHDAIEHYEPYGSMVERLERETGRGKRARDDRGMRSLYNATLAKRNEREAGRW